MKKNSFKELESYLINQRTESSKISTQQNVRSNLNLFELVGNIIELYVPVVPEILTSFDKKYDSKNTPDDLSSDKIHEL